MYPSPAGEAFQENGVWFQDYNVQDPVTGAVSVKRFMHNGAEWVEAPVAQVAPTVGAGKIDFTKRIPDTKAGINLKKNVVNLDKCLISLAKKSGIQLNAHRARVAVVLDYSGSMRPLYRDGSVQRTLTRLIPLGLRFDDNGEVDVWLFHEGYRRMDGIGLDNFETYVDEVITKSGERFGCTSYSPVLRDVLRKYIDEEPSDIPSYVIFITDGANDDRRHTNDTIIESSQHNVFIQFVGLDVDKHETFDYLRKLDDLRGRPVDNTGFFSIQNFDNLSDEELYNQLLSQYVEWLREMHIS